MQLSILLILWLLAGAIPVSIGQFPTGIPSAPPTSLPTSKPSLKPTRSPTTLKPTSIPTTIPTRLPVSATPTVSPTKTGTVISTAMCDFATGLNLPATISGWSCSSALPTISAICSTWTGVTCSIDGQIISIVLNSASTTQGGGSISSSISTVQSLLVLALSKQKLIGSIPTELGQLTNLLNLDLSTNSLTGVIPTQVGLLRKINLMWMYSNTLRGAIPSQLGGITTLTDLRLSANNLTSSIPTQFGGILNLRTLFLANNLLTGPIPTQLGGIAYLRVLDLSSNLLTSTIPPELSGLYLIKTLPEQTNSPALKLDLSNNKLVGTIPDLLLGNTAANVEFLHFRNNFLVGSIPTIIGRIRPNLLDFDVSHNLLSGTIPTQMGRLTLLTNLQLSNNLFNGTLPTQFYCCQTDTPVANGLIRLAALGAGQIPTFAQQNISTTVALLTNLSFLSLTDAHFVGTIPTELGLLTKLSSLVISFNQLSGTIPTQLGALVQLTTLFLQNNLLRSSLPAQLYNLVKLQLFTLTANGFTGQLSTRLGLMTGLSLLEVEINSFTGPIPTQIGQLTNLQILTMASNLFSGTITPDLCSIPLQLLTLCSECRSGPGTSTTRSGCPLLTSLPACIFAEPSPFKAACLGSLRGELAETPALTLAVANISSTAATLTVNVTSVNYAYLYCTAFPAPFVLSSTVQVVAQSSPFYCTNRVCQVSVPNLVPLTSYTFYCYALSLYNVPLPLNTVISNKVVASTVCCKSVYFTQAPAVIDAASVISSRDVFAYVLAAPPSNAVTINHTCSDGNKNVVQTSVTFTSASVSLQGSFIVTGLAGPFTITLVASGPSAGEYDTSLAVASSQLFALNSALAAPVLTSVRFADSGASAYVVFSTATDLAGISAAQWPCAGLLSFSGAAAATCSWLNSSAVLVAFPPTLLASVALPSPDSPVSLVGGILRAACTQPPCASNTAAGTQSTVFLAPFHPLTPVVRLVAPQIFNFADDVIIDPTYSTGGGGRPWQSVAWYVTSSGEFNSTLFQLSYLDPYSTLTNLQSPLVIPGSGTILPPALYVFSLTVTNFLGQSATESAKIRIANATEIPQVSILGPTNVHINIYDELYLQSLVSSANYVLTYTWVVTKEPSLAPLTSVVSQSADPRVFRLAGHVLDTLGTYNFTVHVSTAAGLSSVASVRVFVAEGSLQAVIAGGGVRVVSADQDLALDGSQSVDLALAPGVASGLSFQWSCLFATGDNYGASCDTSVLASVATSSSTLTILANRLTVGVSYRLLLTCSKGGQTDTAFVVVQATVSGAPLVSLTTASARANANDIVRLDGSISAAYSVSAAWTLSSSGVSLALATAATSPVDKVFALSIARPQIGFSLGIDCSHLVPGNTYLFSIAVSPFDVPSVSSTASVSVTVNIAPSQGYLDVTPSSGLAFSTVFALTAVGWVAEEGGYPLQYLFQYTSPATTAPLTVGSRGLKTSVSSELPPAAALPLVVTIFDSYGATASAASSVAVQSQPSLSATNLVNSFVDTLNKSALSYDVNLAVQAVNNVAAYLSSSTSGDTGVNVSVHDLTIGASCDAWLTVLNSQDASANLLDALVASFSLTFNPSKVVSGDTLTSCVSLLSNLSALVTSDLSGLPTSTTALKVAEIVSLFIDSFDQFTSQNSTVAAVAAIGDNLNSLVNALVASVLSNLVAGSPRVTLSSNNVDIAVYHQLLTDLYSAQLQSSGASSITLPVDGLNACGSSSSGYGQLSLTQYATSPYLNSTNITSPVLRLSSSKANYALADTAASNSSFTLTLPFLTAQNFSVVPVDSLGNVTFKLPACTVRRGGAFSPCDCTVLSYTSAVATFSCSVKSNLCAQQALTVSPTAAPSVFSGTLSTSGAGSAALQGYSDAEDIREYAALVESAYGVVVNTLSTTANPFALSTGPAVVVLAVVCAWVLVLVLGLIYFRRWDILDQKVLLYAPETVERINQRRRSRALPTLQHLQDMRKHLDDAFLTGALISEEEFQEEHMEYQRRERWITCSYILLYYCLPMGRRARSKLSILLGGTMIPRFVQAVVRYHPFTWMFTDRSLEKTRVLRFITVLKMILLSIFISTIFFSVYFPNDSICSTYNNSTQSKCLGVPSQILSGQSECTWDAHSSTCSLRPPPESAGFIITVAILTTIIFAPFDMIFWVVLNMVCNRRPILEQVGLNSFFWLGSLHGAPVGYESNIIQAVGYTMRALRAYELRIEDGLSNEIERGKMNLVLTKLGLIEKHGKVELTLWSALVYGSIQNCITARVKKANEKAEVIIQNMRRFTRVSSRESYLLQHFLMEQFDSFFSTSTLRRQFCHYAHDLPKTIHPLPWLLAWIFIIGSTLFFIYWILAWGSSTNGLALVNWGSNFGLHMAEEIFIVSLVRIFIINILLIEMLKPSLQKLHDWFINMSTFDQKTGKIERNVSFLEHSYTSLYKSGLDDGMEQSCLLQKISPVHIAANADEFNQLLSAQMISEVEDVNYYSYQTNAYKQMEKAESFQHGESKAKEGDKGRRVSALGLIEANDEIDV